jgi:type IV pilus assembly protein PilM
MRPVFNDLVTEVQRSVSYFQNIDRKAKIQGVVILGNTVKLPGLQPYLAKNLGYDIVNFEQFHRLDENAVGTSPAYKENQLAFGVCYGLCLQGLHSSKLNTNLIPREIVVERMIRAKKPWIVACVASLLLACSFNFFFHYSTWFSVHKDRKVDGVSFTDAEAAISSVQSVSQDYQKKDKENLDKKKLLERIGDEVVGNADRRILWLELITAVNQVLPRTEGLAPGTVPNAKDFPFDKRDELHILSVETQYFDDLSTWYTDFVKTRYQEGRGVLQGETPETANATQPAGTFAATTTTDQSAGPKGEGFVIQLEGYHFKNSDPQTAGATHVINQLIRRLEDDVVHLPNPKAGGEDVLFTMKELGISYPVLTTRFPIQKDYRIANPNYAGPAPKEQDGEDGATRAPGNQTGYPNSGGIGGVFPSSGTGGSFPSSGFPGSGTGTGFSGGSSGMGNFADNNEPDVNGEMPYYAAPKYDFVVQFCWQPKLLTKRLKEKEEEARRKEEAEKAAQPQPGQTNPQASETVAVRS